MIMTMAMKQTNSINIRRSLFAALLGSCCASFAHCRNDDNTAKTSNVNTITATSTATNFQRCNKHTNTATTSTSSLIATATTNPRRIAAFQTVPRDADNGGDAHRHRMSFQTKPWSSVSNSQTDTDANNVRTKTTDADMHYASHGCLPKPFSMHANLMDLMKNDYIHENNTNGEVLVIGDVHGCINELQSLHSKASTATTTNLIRAVILVGDLCNKGPHSAAVIRHVREQKGWYAVRGNHDDGALAAALGDVQQRMKSKYSWIVEGEQSISMERGKPHHEYRHDGNHHDDVHDDPVEERKEKYNDDDENHYSSIRLSDQDVEWLANLPYTITIPSSFFQNSSGPGYNSLTSPNSNENGNGNDPRKSIQTNRNENENENENENMDTNVANSVLSEDTIIVHAGLIPNIPLEQQDVETMTTLRDVELMSNGENYRYHHRHRQYNQQPQTMEEGVDTDTNSSPSTPKPKPKAWASVWKGPQHVIFGHDAKRGLQIHHKALGLDTGVCYGKQLTGVLLPSGRIVSVDAQRVHSPLGGS